MKRIKILAAIIVVVVLSVSLFACERPDDKNPNTPNRPTSSSGFTPANITKLKGINLTSQDYNAAAQTYGDVSEQVERLDARIKEKHDDIYDGDEIKEGNKHSSAVIIFANCEGDEIINAMSQAGLTRDKMLKTVDYLAGDPDKKVTDEDIDALIDKPFAYSNTDGWSLFDDWDYYERLQDKADGLTDTTAKNNANDDVKRQYRNILRKVFNIGMTEPEFGRVATFELVYATAVVEGMAGSTISTSTTGAYNQFDEYCMEELDYETLVYLRAFNAHYNGGVGKNNCIALYSYYYLYEKNSYSSTTDEEFETQLKYGHQETFTDAEWLEYVALQRQSYEKAYRYEDAYYNTFYNAHLTFQEISENQEIFVYGLSKQWNGRNYTADMRSAIRNDGLKGQLAQTDWSWCYSGDNEKMRSYNAANTLQKTATGAEIDHGDFDMEMEQLKYAEYMLTNMSTTELSGALYFEVYSYSGETVRTGREYEKELVLLAAGKKAPEDITTIPANQGVDLNDEDAKSQYVNEKMNVIMKQFTNTYNTVGVDAKATAASSRPWGEMLKEVTAAINYDYSSLSTWADKKNRMDENVLKKVWSCNNGDDNSVCAKNTNPPHIECERIYDTNHKLSQFASNYEIIMRYMVGSLQISFNTIADSSNYEIAVYGSTALNGSAGMKYTVGYNGTLQDVWTKASSITYVTKDGFTVAITSGKTFKENADETNSEAYEFWNNNTASNTKRFPPKNARRNAQETDSTNHQSGTFDYEYEFAGWFYDTDLKFIFDENDDIRSDLELYAGYNCTKKRLN